MRVCMVISVPLPPGEGIGYYTWNLSRFLLSQGHQVQIITRGERGKPPREVLDGIPIWRPPFYPTYPFHVHLHGLFLQRLVRRLEGEIDIFHLHTPLPPPLRTQRPVLLTVHSMMLADVRSRRTESLFDVLSKLQAPVSTRIERRLFRISGRIAAVSQAAARDMQPLLLHEGKTVEVTWNGVDTGFFSPDGNEIPESGTLLFVGRLAPGKGLADLVQAMTQVARQVPGARLLVAGDGPLHKKLGSLIAQSGLEGQIELLGHVQSRERLRTLYRESWAFVLPSHHESMPTVVLEAMACGTPVISTRVGSVPDFIVDGSNGLLVPPRAPEAMAGAISKLLGDQELCARLGAAARRTVEDRFSWQAVGAAYLRCYRALLEETGPVGICLLDPAHKSEAEHSPRLGGRG
jgi:glycosyltransferase involved in cell wall biosynthesis